MAQECRTVAAYLFALFHWLRMGSAVCQAQVYAFYSPLHNHKFDFVTLRLHLIENDITLIELMIHLKF